MSQHEWVEPRGPQIPDAINRVPVGVWPFLALTVLALYGRWTELARYQIGHPIDIVLLIVDSIPAVVAPLLGVALFARHPDAHRRLPAVTFGVVLFATSTVVDTLRVPVLESIANLGSEFDPASPAVLGYGIVQALIRAFAATYLAIGLSEARRFEDRIAGRAILALLVAGAIAPAVISGLIGWPWPDEMRVANLVTLASNAVTNLAWAYLGWTAFRGWAAGEEPAAGWALAAVAGIGYVVLVFVATVLRELLFGISAAESQPPFIFELFQLLGIVVAALWIALLAGFIVGLPAVEAGDDDEADDVVEGDPELRETF